MNEDWILPANAEGDDEMKSRSMNRRDRSPLMLLLVGALLIAAPAARADDVYENEFKIDSGGKIELDMEYGGSLHAKGWDRDVVKVECEDERYGIDQFSFEFELINDRLIRFTVSLEDEDDNGSNNLRVRIMVPKKFDIETKSGGGGITIIGVEGDFEGMTGGGSVHLKDLKGNVDLSTGGGSIDISDSELDGTVTTGGGKANVRNVVGNLVATSGGGNVSYKNVRDHDGDRRMPDGLESESDYEVSDETIVYSSAGGSIRLPDAPEGALITTGGGNITIRNAERFVDATTGGGNIEVEIRDGSVHAMTGAGDIEIVVEGDLGDGDEGVSLSTGSGEIVLTLPGDISAELDLDLSYTRNSSRSFKIVSDFDLDEERTDKWESRHGTPRKHIYGTGKLGGGKYLIKVRCVNGNIRLKKRG